MYGENWLRLDRHHEGLAASVWQVGPYQVRSMLLIAQMASESPINLVRNQSRMRLRPELFKTLLPLILSKLKRSLRCKPSPTPYPKEMSTHDLPNSTKNGPNNDPNRSNHGPLQDREQYTAERIVSTPPS